MGDAVARATHYMTFRHSLPSRTRQDFDMYLYKNGELVLDIPIEVFESPATSGIYTFSFANDGTHESTWTLIINDSGASDYWYHETWEVRKKITENTVKQLRSRQEGDGGFFTPPTENKS